MVGVPLVVGRGVGWIPGSQEGGRRWSADTRVIAVMGSAAGNGVGGGLVERDGVGVFIGGH